jgi:hypothetical protein
VTRPAQAAGSSGAAGDALAAGMVEAVNNAATSESAVIVFFTATFFLNAQFIGSRPEKTFLRILVRFIPCRGA